MSFTSQPCSEHTAAQEAAIFRGRSPESRIAATYGNRVTPYFKARLSVGEKHLYGYMKRNSHDSSAPQELSKSGTIWQTASGSSDPSAVARSGNLPNTQSTSTQRSPAPAQRTSPSSSRVRAPVNNTEYFPPNFEGLVLGCIDADFCK